MTPLRRAVDDYLAMRRQLGVTLHEAGRVPAHMEVRRVSTAGTFRVHPRQPFLSQALKNQDIGLEEVVDGIWKIVYYTTLLGKIDERTLLITGV